MKINEVFPLTNTGIFATLQTLNPNRYAWADASVDLLYIGHSGNKTTAPIVDTIIEQGGDGVLLIVSAMLDKMYGDKWDRTYKALIAEYELLQNYSITEIETPNITRTSERKTATDMQTDSNGNSNASGYGFNSTSPVPQARSNASTGQRLHGDADNNVENVTDTETGTRTHERTGLTETPQQIISREIELRKQNFISMVITDTDRVLTCPMYE